MYNLSLKRLKNVRRGMALAAALLLALLTVFSCAALAAEGASEQAGRWGAAADEIDRYLDAGFEAYLERYKALLAAEKAAAAMN